MRVPTARLMPTVTPSDSCTPSACALTATMPPAWSPGLALRGTVMVNGIDTDLPAGMVTVDFASFTHEPTPVLGSPAWRSANPPPPAALNASAG
ncbi:MAG: hypothetical protein U0S36_14060 [Candidatus Nanopelagicales bacterium]